MEWFENTSVSRLTSHVAIFVHAFMRSKILTILHPQKASCIGHLGDYFFKFRQLHSSHARKKLNEKYSSTRSDITVHSMGKDQSYCKRIAHFSVGISEVTKSQHNRRQQHRLQIVHKIVTFRAWKIKKTVDLLVQKLLNDMTLD